MFYSSLCFKADCGRSAPRPEQEALARNLTLEVMNHAAGRHGFDILDDDARSREIIARTLEFPQARLQE